MEMQWQHEWGGKILFSHGSKDSRGVAIVFNNKSNIDVTDIYRDDFGRILIINITKSELNFSVTNIYAPNIEHLQVVFYEDLNKLFIENDFEFKDKIIFGGDFNCILNPNLDKKGGIFRHKENVVNRINDVIDTFDSIDIWRYLNPGICRYTWRQTNPLIQCRLDYFLISNSLIENVVTADICPGIRTDHSGILLTLQLYKEPSRGPGHWKFNNSYLEDDNYVHEMCNNLQVWLNDPSISDLQVRWEWIKFKIRELSRKYAKKKCKFKKDKIAELNERLDQLEIDLAKNPSDYILNEIQVIKLEIEELDANLIDGLIVRSRIRWSEKGEKSNKYFLGLEKRNCRKKHCKKLITDDGVEIINPDEILEKQKDYYECIYESKGDY